MDSVVHRAHRGRGTATHNDGGRRLVHRNRQWVADGVSMRAGTTSLHTGVDSERWERGGHRGGRSRGRVSRGKPTNSTVTFRRDVLDAGATASEGEHSEMDDETEVEEVHPPDPETPEEREKFWQEVCPTNSSRLIHLYRMLRSWSRPVRLNGRRPLQTGKWTTRWCRSHSRTQLLWSGRAKICARDSSGIDANARATLVVNGRPYEFVMLPGIQCADALYRSLEPRESTTSEPSRSTNVQLGTRLYHLTFVPQKFSRCS